MLLERIRSGDPSLHRYGPPGSKGVRIDTSTVTGNDGRH
jgi:hypothetical protein